MTHIVDLREPFPVLQKYNKKLNPAMSAFSIGLAKLQSFMVSE